MDFEHSTQNDHYGPLIGEDPKKQFSPPRIFEIPRKSLVARDLRLEANVLSIQMI